jgi:hypothetical protein
MEIRWTDGLSVPATGIPAHVVNLLNRPIREFPSGIRPLYGEEREAAIAKFKTILRGLVDQWIDSGRVNEAVTGDEPKERNIIWRSPLYPKPLFETLVKFWAAHSARVVELNGSLVLQVGPSESAGTEDALSMAGEYATFEFARLLDSPSPQRLSRCDGCGQYFVRQRVPQKRICHGTFCPRTKCRSMGGAKRVVDSRKQLAQDKIQWAVDAVEKWKPTRRFGEKPDWVVQQVNAKLPRGESVKVNWYSWHRKDIEAEVNRRKHAKG